MAQFMRMAASMNCDRRVSAGERPRPTVVEHHSIGAAHLLSALPRREEIVPCKRRFPSTPGAGGKAEGSPVLLMRFAPAAMAPTPASIS
jgi:hypothetical protein